MLAMLAAVREDFDRLRAWGRGEPLEPALLAAQVQPLETSRSFVVPELDRSARIRRVGAPN